MSNHATNRPRVPRESLSTRIGSLDLPNAKAFAKFILEGDPDEPLPCWGAISTRFVQSFTTDTERLAVLDQLIAEGDQRPLQLFIHTGRNRPALVAAMCERANELPVTVQRSLAAIPEAAEFVAKSIDEFSPAARRVWDGGEELRRAERELLASRIGELVSFQYFVPDTFDPRYEPAPNEPDHGDGDVQ